MKKKKLLFLINTLACGGAEKVLVTLLNKLDKTKYKIDLLAVEDGVNAKALNKNIAYRYILKGKDGLIKKIAKFFIYHLPYALFARCFIKDEYDCEIAFLEGRPTRIIAKHKTKAKKIAVVHCNLTYEMLARLYKDSDEMYDEYANYGCVVFVSQSARRNFESNIGKLDNAKVLHNIMEVSEIKKLSSQYCPMQYKTTGLKLISIGRLEKVKGFDRLLNIVSRLERKYNFELWIVGDGSQREYLEKQLMEREIRSIKMQGYQINPYSYLKQADIYVCSSYTEGYSTVVKESLICGIPIITTNCGGMGEIISDGGNGYIVDNSEEGLEKGLEKLLMDQITVQKLKNGALQYMNGYNMDKEIKEYEKLLDGEDDV